MTKKRGKGWHGDSEGHARAGRKGGMLSSGNFRNDGRRKGRGQGKPRKF
jgi:general stress protein YciG